MTDRIAAEYGAAIRDFKATMQRFTEEAACGRRYVLVTKLKEWLRSKVRPDSNLTHVGCLLRGAYHGRSKKQPGLPVDLEQFQSDDNCRLVMFSILLELDRGALVDRFQRQNIVDAQLPINLQSLQEKLETLHISDAEELAAKFNDLQWRFCAAKLDLNMSWDHKREMTIPIHNKEKINSKGGTATLWQIEVREEFVSDRLRQAVLSSRYGDPPDACYQFALKTFEEGNRDLYVNEKDAFVALQKKPGIIQYLGEYEHKEIRRASTRTNGLRTGAEEEEVKTTYNILLEFGERDLDEHFAGQLPPVLHTEVEAFWKELFAVAGAVEVMHNLKTNIDGEVEEYYGWHADIKPDNILSVQGRFKLADPGFAMFVEKGPELPKEFVLGGTETYGAPERHPGRRDHRNAVPQTIDIWSLGCVFSMAATWVVLGYQGIQQFNKLREKAIKGLVQEQRLHPHLQGSYLSLDLGDYFHNGRQVLSDVISWHDFLRSHLRKTDQITGKVLEVVDQKMLLPSSDRINAENLCTALNRILASNQAETKPSIPKTIMEALLEVDEEAPSSIIPSGSLSTTNTIQFVTNSHNHKTRKSKLPGLPLMKTTHRSEYLKSALAQISEPNPPSPFHIYPIETLPVRSEFSGLHVSSPEFPEWRQSKEIGQPGASRMSVSTFAKPPGKSTITSQNVFQAREEIEKRQNKGFIGKTRKDDLLTRHFGNRDIVRFLLLTAKLEIFKRFANVSKKFLVDNAETMKDFWYEATYLLETLVMKARGQDENGIDLSFTGGPVQVENKKQESEFKKAMKKPQAMPKDGVRPDIRKQLGNIFAKYLQDLDRRRVNPYMSEPRNLTLIIFTDGIWAGVPHKGDIDSQIVSFVRDLQNKIGNLKHRPVGLEFVQFGDDARATERLRQLDNNLKSNNIPDIIDTEPSTGNVNKMLLGSFVEEYDDEGDDDEAVPNTPPLNTSVPGASTRSHASQSWEHNPYPDRYSSSSREYPRIYR